MRIFIRPLLVIFILLTAVTGFIYPLVVTQVGAELFPSQIRGSLMTHDGNVVGSELIGQSFTDPKYFWGRLSATAPVPYNPSASGGSNWGPSNPALIEAAQVRIDALRARNPDDTRPIPVDLVTASGSGLDPHISPAAALYQVTRVARERHLDPEMLRRRVLDQVEAPQWGLFGEPRINVLMLNLALDRAQ